MVISAINALTLSPALCAILLKPHHGPKRGVLGWISRGIDRGARRLCRMSPGTSRGGRSSGFCCWRWRSAQPAGCSASFRPVSCRARTRARSSSKSACPKAPPSTARDAVVKRVETMLGEIEGVAKRDHRHRLQLSRRPVQVEQRLCHRDDEAVRRAHERCAPPSMRRSRPLWQGDRRSARRRSFAFNLPPIVGLGTGSGFEYQLLDTQGRPPAELAATARRADHRGQPEPAARADIHHLFGRVRRSSTSISTATGCRRWASR